MSRRKKRRVNGRIEYVHYKRLKEWEHNRIIDKDYKAITNLRVGEHGIAKCGITTALRVTSGYIIGDGNRRFRCVVNLIEKMGRTDLVMVPVIVEPGSTAREIFTSRNFGCRTVSDRDILKVFHEERMAGKKICPEDLPLSDEGAAIYHRLGPKMLSELFQASLSPQSAFKGVRSVWNIVAKHHGINPLPEMPDIFLEAGVEAITQKGSKAGKSFRKSLSIIRTSRASRASKVRRYKARFAPFYAPWRD